MTTRWIHCGPSDARSESAKCCEWCSDRSRGLLLLLLLLWENCQIAGPFDNSDNKKNPEGVPGALYVLMTFECIVGTGLNTFDSRRTENVPQDLHHTLSRLRKNTMYLLWMTDISQYLDPKHGALI